MNACLPLFSAAASDRSANILATARALSPHLGRSRPLDRQLVSRTMTTSFGGTDAEGEWSWKDAYDACEIALVLQMRRLAPQIGRVEDAPADIAAMLQALGDLTPTHTRRSEEQVELDQFSTPPAVAALTVAAAQIRPGDLVLEPSAGTGLLAIVAEACGATVHLNEFAATRADYLQSLFPQVPVTRHDAAYLQDILVSSGTYHAVITNPPFQVLMEHLQASLACLADGGRMTAVVPTTFFANPDNLAVLSQRGAIVAAIALPKGAFYKHGTSVETAILVVDRTTTPSTWDGVLQHFDDLAEVGHAIAAIPARENAQARTFRQVAVQSLLTPKLRTLSAPSGRLSFLNSVSRLEYTTKDWTGEGRDVGIYKDYQVSRIQFAKSIPHPSQLVESSAMGSVAPPVPTFRPMLPTVLLEKGLLSDAQMETVVYATEAFSRKLPGRWLRNPDSHELTLAKDDADGAFQLRQGFFLGDGTGCGKGRQAAGTISAVIASVIGFSPTKRAVWLSKNDTLIEDARRDWVGIGGSATDIVSLSNWKMGEAIGMESGILFSTYATLRQAARGDKRSRLDQIVDLLGEDFDGVIVFDEAHAMANAAGGGDGARGAKKPSLQGIAGLALQNRLPNACVMYVSATGATTAQNLAYAARLGLWGGPEAPFMTRENFLNAVDSGGVAVMELIARELKAMGCYIARSLSFEGVEYDALRHELTDLDIEIWNSWADAFQIIHKNLHTALHATGALSGSGKASGRHMSAIMSAFESNKQRFFAHLLAGIKAPTLIADIRAQLSADRSAIIQIVSTNEAVMERRLAQIPAEEFNNLSIDLTPKEYVLEYLRNGFPTVRMKTIEDEDGNVTTEPLLVDGSPVQCQEALEIRDNLIVELSCLPAVKGVLDAVIHELGTDVVAEVTGRTRRIVKRGGRLLVERRGSSAAKSETDAFMSGRKRVLIFSDAGGTGRSYHADKACENRQRRVHYLVEPGWRADAAVQGLGRSHRTNQESAPLFRPVTTNIAGEKRFLSTIARRLDTLGALTKGERRTAGNGLFSANDNLESPWAREALNTLFDNLVWGNATCMTLDEFTDKTALKLTAGPEEKPLDEYPPMHTFLNRVLALRIADQDRIFEELEAILAAILERATAAGHLDTGMEDIKAESLEITSDTLLRTDTFTGAQTRLIAFDVKHKRDILTSDEALDRLRSKQNSSPFYINSKSGYAAIVQLGQTDLDEKGAMIKAVQLTRPDDRKLVDETTFFESNWQQVTLEEWRLAWDAQVAKIDPFVTRSMVLVTGQLLPIWTKLPQTATLVRRLTAQDGRRWLGRLIDPNQVQALRLALGLASIDELTADTDSIVTRILEKGDEIELTSDLWLKRSRVMDRYRIEIGNAAAERAKLSALGAFTEIINFTPRLFIRVNEPEVVRRVLQHYPAIGLHSASAQLAA